MWSFDADTTNIYSFFCHCCFVYCNNSVVIVSSRVYSSVNNCKLISSTVECVRGKISIYTFIANESSSKNSHSLNVINNRVYVASSAKTMNAGGFRALHVGLACLLYCNIKRKWRRLVDDGEIRSIHKWTVDLFTFWKRVGDNLERWNDLQKILWTWILVFTINFCFLPSFPCKWLASNNVSYVSFVRFMLDRETHPTMKSLLYLLLTVGWHRTRPTKHVNKCEIHEFQSAHIWHSMGKVIRLISKKKSTHQIPYSQWSNALCVPSVFCWFLLRPTLKYVEILRPRNKNAVFSLVVRFSRLECKTHCAFLYMALFMLCSVCSHMWLS